MKKKFATGSRLISRMTGCNRDDGCGTHPATMIRWPWKRKWYKAFVGNNCKEKVLNVIHTADSSLASLLINRFVFETGSELWLWWFRSRKGKHNHIILSSSLLFTSDIQAIHLASDESMCTTTHRDSDDRCHAMQTQEKMLVLPWCKSVRSRLSNIWGDTLLEVTIINPDTYRWRFDGWSRR